MRICIAILLLFVYSGTQAQDLDATMEQFNIALIRKDTVALNRLVHKDVSYGHSNGWIETKTDIKANLYNGKLVYDKIGQEIIEVVKEGNTACIRSNATIGVVFNGKPMTFKLHILQVWVMKDKKWQLIARQSAQID